MLPYIYTHLVSLACAIYLIVSAIIKGASATPALDGQTTALHAPLLQTSHPLASPLLSSHTPAHPLPLPDVCAQQASTSSRTPPTCLASSSRSPSILLLSMTVLGLVLIGSVLANPLGPNRESFAVCHFVNYTCTSSLEAVSADRAPTLLRSFESGAEAPSGAAVVAGGSGGGNRGGNKLDANAIAEVKRMIAEERENLEKLTLQNVANRMSKGAAEAAAANWGSTTPAPAPSATSKWRVTVEDVVGKRGVRACTGGRGGGGARQEQEG